MENEVLETEVVEGTETTATETETAEAAETESVEDMMAAYNAQLDIQQTVMDYLMEMYK